MMKRKDDGATDVVAFMIIISFVMIGVLIWLFVFMPVYGENHELTHNDEVLEEMAGMKYQIDTLMLSQTTGVSRSAVISLGPRGDKDMVTFLPDLTVLLSSGTITIEKGSPGYRYQQDRYQQEVTYYPLKITYSSSNSYAEDITLIYEKGILKDEHEHKFLEGIAGMYPVVNEGFNPITLGGNEFAVIKFYLDGIVPSGSSVYYNLFTVEMDGSYNG